MVTASNKDLLDDLDQEGVPPTRRALNASFLSGTLDNVKNPEQQGSLLRETKGTGLGGQSRKPPPKTEGKPFG